MTDILPYKEADLDAVLRITQSAWEPVFPLMRQDIPDYVYDAFYPKGWRERQLGEVEAVCRDSETDMWIARTDAAVSGFLGLRVHAEDSMGEVYIIAVDPQFQKQGVGRALLDFSFHWMRKRDLTMAFVETGADRGHAPARASYERVGFERYPVARYFKKL